MTPEEVGYALDMGQQALFKHYREHPNEDALLPFTKETTLTTDSTGFVAVPSDYAHILDIYGVVNGEIVTYEPILHKEVGDALRSALFPIADYPRYVRDSAGLQFYPRAVHTVTLSYFSKPTTPVIGYTTSGNAISYNSGTSTQLVFKDNYWMEVILKALSYLGVNLGAPEVFALSQQMDHAEQ